MSDTATKIIETIAGDIEPAEFADALVGVAYRQRLLYDGCNKEKSDRWCQISDAMDDLLRKWAREN